MNDLCFAYYNYGIDILNYTCQAPVIKAEAGKYKIWSITVEKWMFSVWRKPVRVGWRRGLGPPGDA